MSNSFTSPPVLVDPARTTAGLTIRSEEASRLGDMNNYAFAHTGCGTVISQAWDDQVWPFSTNSMTDVCEWYVPHPSEEHVEFKLRVMAHSSVSGNTAKATVTFPTTSNSYFSTGTITDTARFGSAFTEITVAISAVESDRYAIVKLSLQAASSAVIYVAGVQGNWSALSSPLATRSLDQYGSEFIPAGATRLGADLPLTSRFGVDTLSNIDLVRQRGRVLLSWSGVQDSDTYTQQGALHKAALGVGSYDPELMFSEAAIFAGMPENGLDVDVFINAANISAALEIELFGYRLTISSNGWNAYSLDNRLTQIERSVEFRLPMYRVGLEQTEHNVSNLLSDTNRASNSVKLIKGLAIIGA